MLRHRHADSTARSIAEAVEDRRSGAVRRLGHQGQDIADVVSGARQIRIAHLSPVPRGGLTVSGGVPLEIWPEVARARRTVETSDLRPGGNVSGDHLRCVLDSRGEHCHGVRLGEQIEHGVRHRAQLRRSLRQTTSGAVTGKGPA